MNRNSIFWGMALLLLGGLFFLQASGIKLPGNGNVWDYFWALFLMLLGVWVLVGFLWRGGEPSAESASIDLGAARDALVRFDHGAGEINVTGGAGSGKLLEGSFASGVKIETKMKGDRLEAEVQPQFSFPFFGDWRGLRWNVSLNNDVPLVLDFNTGASRLDLDLRDLRVTSLDLDAGASSLNVVLPANAGQTRVKVDMGAASLDMRVPDGVAATIQIDQGASGVNIDPRFPRVGGVYQSADYAAATNRVEIDIDAGAGSITIH
jgi:hypothetical protein